MSPLPGSNHALTDELTRREREVLRALAAGLTAPEVAVWLAISTDTVRSHVSHLRDKLRARTVAQAVAEAYDRRILP